jgi:signal transduction histidine kinase
MIFGYEVTDLVRARQARDDFLSVAGHELRTPITALALQLDSLARQIERGRFGGVDPELVLRIDKARGHVARVDRLVGELLDVARIGAGRLGMDLEEVDLAEVVHDVVDRFALEAQQAGCELRFTAAGPVAGRWDRIRCEQIVMNLVSNAVKYGAGKPIDIDLDGDEARARVMVRDRGIGVAVADRERIFERFERAVSDRSFGGLGLGLWISRQLAAAMGGTITVGDGEAGGSVFTVELPRVTPA